MRKIFKNRNLLAALLALVMLLGSFPMVYAEEIIPEIPAEVTEAVAEEARAAEAETGEAPAAEEIPEIPEAQEVQEIPEAQEEIPADLQTAPAAEAVPAVEETPAAEEAPAAPAAEEVPAAEEETPAAEEIPAAEEKAQAAEEVPATEEVTPAAEEAPAAEETPEAADEEEIAEETTEETAEEDSDEEFVEFDDDDAGTVSEELLDEFNNPETFEAPETRAEAEIVLKNSELRYGEAVTLAARVSGVELNCRIVWEASDGDERGWFTVGSGPEYTFTLTPEVVEREYRVVLFSVD